MLYTWSTQCSMLCSELGYTYTYNDDFLSQSMVLQCQVYIYQFISSAALVVWFLFIKVLFV